MSLWCYYTFCERLLIIPSFLSKWAFSSKDFVSFLLLQWNIVGFWWGRCWCSKKSSTYAVLPTKYSLFWALCIAPKNQIRVGKWFSMKNELFTIFEHITTLVRKISIDIQAQTHDLSKWRKIWKMLPIGHWNPISGHTSKTNGISRATNDITIIIHVIDVSTIQNQFIFPDQWKKFNWNESLILAMLTNSILPSSLKLKCRIVRTCFCVRNLDAPPTFIIRLNVRNLQFANSFLVYWAASQILRT